MFIRSVLLYGVKACVYVAIGGCVFYCTVRVSSKGSVEFFCGAIGVPVGGGWRVLVLFLCWRVVFYTALERVLFDV